MADPDEVRAWAKAQGMRVSDRGRMRAEVFAAYEAAHPDEDEAQPDFGATEAGDIETATPDEGPGPAAPDHSMDAAPGPGPSTEGPEREPGPDGAEPPPPASLEAARARLGPRDKTRAPWAKPAAARKRKTKAEIPKLSARDVADLEGKVMLLMSGPAAIWAAADPACGAAAADNIDNMVRKAVPLIAQSPAALKLLSEGGKWLLWLDFAFACQPVAAAVIAHHVTGSIMVTPTGHVVASRRLEDGRIVPLADAPPGPGPDNSAYTTQVRGHVPQPQPRPA
jgi:Lsr2